MVEINEGCLSVPDLRGERRRATSTVRVRYLDRDGDEHDEVQARADRRHVPARGRPPRRRAVPRPRDATRRRSRPGSSSSASTARTSSARARAIVERVGLVTRATGASSPGSAASAPRPACWSRSTATRIAAVDARRREPPAGAERLDGLTLPGLANAHSHAFQRALRGRTQARRAARSGPGASRCTRSPSALDPDSLPARSRARRSPRWRWPGSRASASSTTSTTGPAARPTTTRTRWARR